MSFEKGKKEKIDSRQSYPRAGLLWSVLFALLPPQLLDTFKRRFMPRHLVRKTSKALLEAFVSVPEYQQVCGKDGCTFLHTATAWIKFGV
jgi:hypothetical protein